MDNHRNPPPFPDYPNLPNSRQNSYNEGPPPLPNDPSIFTDDRSFQDEDDELTAIETAAAAAQAAADAGLDLSQFDKEYILKGLARLYKKKILPLELSSRYGHFHSPPLSPADFVAPPMVLLLGQYR